MMYVAHLKAGIVEIFYDEASMEARVTEFLNQDNGVDEVRVYELGTAYDVTLGGLEYVEADPIV